MGGASVKTWIEALRLLAGMWPGWLRFAVVTAAAAGLAAGWLWTPLSRSWQLLLNLAYLLGAGALAAWGLTCAHRRFAPEGIRLLRALQLPEFWGALALFALAGLWLPARLMTWVPGFQTLAAQAWSAGVRAALAWALFTGAICWLFAFLGLISRERT